MGSAQKALLLTALMLAPAAMAGAERGSARTPPPPIGADSQGMFFVSYPDSSLRRNEQGSVGYQVSIGTDGIPFDCVVTRSSGHKRLDHVTCMAAVQHARFIPATDDDGQPIRSVYAGRVDWTIR